MAVVFILCFAIFQLCKVSSSLEISLASDSLSAPSLPDKFTLRTEIVMKSMQNVILYIEESYDKALNRLALTVDGQGQRSKAILQFEDGILFNLNSENGHTRCHALPCSTSDCLAELQNLLPQAVQLPQLHGSFWANQLLGYDPKNPPVYGGREMWHNILVDKWNTYSDASSKNISTYWTADIWKTSIATRVPVAVKVAFKGRTEIVHLTIAQYTPNVIDEEELQMPQGVYCSLWPSKREFPLKNNKADAVQFNTEIVLKNEPELSWSEVYYSFSDNLYRIDYATTEKNAITIFTSFVVDLKHDVYFMKIKHTEQPDYCYMGTSSEFVFPFIAFLPLGPNATFPKNVDELFGMSAGSFVYNGKHHNRYFEVYSWLGLVSDGINKIRLDALWEWEFVHLKTGHYAEHVPIRKIITVINSNNSYWPAFKATAQTIHHIHNFQLKKSLEMGPWIYDVVSCHNVWLHLEFRLKGVQDVNPMSLSDNKFLNIWRKEIAKQLLKSVLYVTQLQVVHFEKQHFLRFKLLDGTVDNPDSPPHNMTSLLNMERQLKILIDEGTLFITWSEIEILNQNLSAAVGSLRRVELCMTTVTPNKIIQNITLTTEVPTPESMPNRYSAGIAAATSVGFFILGFSVTTSITYIIQKLTPSLFIHQQT